MKKLIVFLSCLLAATDIVPQSNVIFAEVEKDTICPASQRMLCAIKQYHVKEEINLMNQKLDIIDDKWERIEQLIIELKTDSIQ